MNERQFISFQCLFSRTGSISSGTETPGVATPTLQRKRLSTRPGGGEVLALSLEDSSYIRPSWKEAKKPKARTRGRTRAPSTRHRKAFKLNLQTSAAKLSNVVEKSKTPEFRFRVVVGLLFGCVLIMILITKYYHDRLMIMKAVDDQMYFWSKSRNFHMLNTEGRLLARLELGAELPRDIEPTPCFCDKDQYRNGTRKPKRCDICLDFKYRSRLEIKFIDLPQSQISCYNVTWKAYGNAMLKDCILLRDSGFWYGAGEMVNLSWPLNGPGSKLNHPDRVFVTGHEFAFHQNDPTKNWLVYRHLMHNREGHTHIGDAELRGTWIYGSIIKRYWLSSKGLAVTIPMDVPLYVSMGNEKSYPDREPRMCFGAQVSKFPYRRTGKKASPHLSYMICSGPNITSLHKNLSARWKRSDSRVLGRSQKFGATNKTTSEAALSNNNRSSPFLSKIVWSTSGLSKLSDDSLQGFADRILSYGFQPGIIVLDSRWETLNGEFELNIKLIQNHQALFSVLHNKGFLIMLTVGPHLHINSPRLEEAIHSGRLLSDQDLNVPLLTRCPNSLATSANHSTTNRLWNGERLGAICGMVDLTVPNHRLNLRRRVTQLRTRYSVDGFMFQPMSTSLMPRFEELSDKIDLNRFSLLFQDVIATGGSLIGIQSHVGLNHYCSRAYIRMTPLRSDWESLRSLITTALTLSITGHGLINLGPVGGLHALNSSYTLAADKELYLRWMQLAFFMPVVEMTDLPISSNGTVDPELIRAANELQKVRSQYVVPELNKLFSEYEMKGLPIIRPLWWSETHDPEALKIDDQFMIGDSILVAPIIKKSTTQRDIYLPPGWWSSPLDGQLIKGGKVERNYRLPSTKVAFFIKK